MKILTLMMALATVLMFQQPALAKSKKSKVNQFETGFIPGSTANRAKKPNLLGRKGIGRLKNTGKLNQGSYTSRTARIAFHPLNGNFRARKPQFTGLLKANLKRKRIKIVGLDQNPTHVIKGQLTYLPTSSGTVVFHRWKLYNRAGKKLKTFVDTERGIRFNSRRPEYGIGDKEISKVSRTTADRLKFWLDGGAS